jgi:hypothetical protein
MDNLTDLIDRKELLLIDLTRTCQQQRHAYEQEKSQLTQLIQQLKYENSQLKARQQ